MKGFDLVFDLKKRRFLQRAPLIIFFASATGEMFMAVSCADVVSELETYLPIGLTAFSGVVSIINPIAGSALSIASGLATKLWGDITPALNNYTAAPASAKSTPLGELLTALQSAEGQVSVVDSDLATAVNINQTDLKASQAVLLVITATLSSIQAKLAKSTPTVAAPAPPAAVASARAARPSTVAVGTQTLDVTAASNGKDFRNKVNQIWVAAGHPERKV